MKTNLQKFRELCKPEVQEEIVDRTCEAIAKDVAAIKKKFNEDLENGLITIKMFQEWKQVSEAIFEEIRKLLEVKK